MRNNFKLTALFLALLLVLAVGYVYAQPGSEKSGAGLKEDSGTYLGQIDPHSIEIQISGVPAEVGPRAFQLSGRVQGEFAGYGLETGDQVKFSYTMKEQGQSPVMTIEKIEKIGSKVTDEFKQDSGTYLGQMDPHSIEIQISGTPAEVDPRAFQLSGRVQGEFAGYVLETGDQVKFSYTVKEQGQSAVMTIEKIEKIGSKVADEFKQDSGTYLGQIDPHSIEIRISGVPAEVDPRAFQLSGRVQGEFAGYALEAGDQVKFSYSVKEQGQSSVMTIEKIEKIKK